MRDRGARYAPPSPFSRSAFLSSLIGTIFSLFPVMKFRFRVMLLFLRPPSTVRPAIPGIIFCASPPFPPLPVVPVTVPRRSYDAVRVADALRSTGFELRSPCLHSWFRFH